MDKVAARKLVKDTFEGPFDRPRFTYFSKNLFQSLDQTRPFTYQGNAVPKAYQDYISSLERVGQYVDSDQKKIDTLIVRLKKETSLERARTMQRNFIAWYLNGSRDYKDAALVAFLSPEEIDWRFSLVKMEYNLDDKGKPKPELTPARRWSFLVGAQENSHTAQSQLEKVLESQNKPSLATLEEAFNVEIVTREFFNRYRDLYHRVKEELDNLVARNDSVRKEFEAKNVDTISFAKKLLGQIVFLYFLQKKGWLGVPPNKNWGDGDKHFLRNLINKAIVQGCNFFNSYLEYLFYEALACQNRGTADPAYYPRLQCKIPFLNGGLFDPINDYDWEHVDLTLPNDLFSNRLNEDDEGTGILDIFDLYNFTVREDEPLEKEVAIDPEMLGKVFENLLDVKDRKSKGTYYTPREIVHYMCQESLMNYLDTALNITEAPLAKTLAQQGKLIGTPAPVQSAMKTVEQRVKVPREDIEFLVRKAELALQNDEHTREHGETDTYTFKLPQSIRDNAALIDKKLGAVRVCDPAIGSGAFPVGMMTEIVRARSALNPFLLKDDRSNYAFKRHAIQNCLYGADIDPGAVEIAKLRLWLSLVVDEENINQIQPLPNLDYKIVRGDSLFGVKRVEGDMFSNELEKLKSDYFSQTDTKKKQECREQIDRLIRSLTNKNDTFDFEVYFSEVFHEKGGFDVVIANPPYVFARNSKLKGLTGENKKYFYAHYELAEYQVNLYPLFIEKGTNLLRSNGCLCFVTPNNWLTINTNKTLRKFVLSQSDVIIVNFYSRVFESAEVDSSIIIFRRASDNKRVALFEYTDCFHLITETDCSFFLSRQDHVINIEAFKDTGVASLMDKIDGLSIPLDQVADVKAGLVAYEVGKGNPPQTEAMKKKRVYHSTSKINEDYIKYLDGRNVCRYRLNWSGEFLKYGDNLAAPRNDFRLYSTKRILVRQIPSKPPYCINGCLVEETILNDRNSMNIINFRESPECILGILNSRLTSFWFVHKFGKMQRNTFPQFKINELANFPLPKNRQGKQADITELVKQIMVAKKGNPDADLTCLERQIDQLVYELYGLTPEEITVVEGKK